MTIVVWDGRYVAADSLAARDNLRCRTPYQKIRVKGRTVYAVIGSSGLFDALVYWYESGRTPSELPGDVEGSETMLLVFSEDGRCFLYATDLPYGDEMPEPTAWGTGRDFAIGALDAGCDAKRACEIAVARDIQLGGPIQVVDLTNLPAGDAA